MSEVKYRPDIDGLRAVAVVAVAGFHAFPGYVPGGFVGVDIFFVISGFLISGIILRALEEHRFSYVEFYRRRVRRILPALVLVLSTTLSVGWLLLLPDEYAQLGLHVAAAAGFLSNFLLWQEAGYFDSAAALALAAFGFRPLLGIGRCAVPLRAFLPSGRGVCFSCFNIPHYRTADPNEELRA